MKQSLSNAWFASALLLLSSVCMHAQSAPSASDSEQTGASRRTSVQTPDRDYQGFNAYVRLRGTGNSTGVLLKLDSSLGYDFNRSLGVFVGIPVYFAHDAADSAAGLRASQSRGLGDFYFGGDFYSPSRWVDYTSTLTLEAPTGNVAEGFSTGHFSADWSNRFRHNFGLLAPYVVAGVANTVPDTETLTRAFSSFGKIIHLEEGSDVNLGTRAYVGASLYQIFPFGNQVVVSPLDSPGRNAPDPVVVSGNDLTRENGFDTWAGFEPSRTVRMELGYSRSVTFDINRVSFGLSFNLGRALHLRRSH